MTSDDNRASDLPTLEKVLIAFQKSMARITQTTNNASKHDPDFLAGNRSLFTVEALDIDMKAGLTMGPGISDPADATIRLDFHAPTDSRSSIKFRVEPKPLEQISGRRLMLTRLDPPEGRPHLNRFLVWFWNGTRLEPKTDIVLRFVPTGAPGREKRVQTRTDGAGRLNFSVDAKNGVYASPMTSKPGNFSLNMEYDWFVLAQLKDEPDRESIQMAIKK